ncbi:MAG TPA: hypothetical protein VJ994_11470, partial [Paracoccaceae bacterium]|nr:hypothetical protein [Paracoccaceae bacterium]
RGGQVVVAGAETYAVDLAGDGLFAFEFDQATAGVSAAQAGEIVNAGGEVLISAASADAMVDNVVSVEGVVSADLADGAGGSVTVSAPGGEALVAGEVSARGGDGDGGRVDVRARDVDVTGTARLDVSGSARGGAAVILAEERMAFAGTALARGAESGGFVETSGAEVSVTGRVSAGPGGTWLIDPTDIDIGGGDDDVTAASARAAIEDGTGLVVETVDTGGEAGNITVFGAALAGLDLAPGVSESSITLLADGQVVLAGSGGITQAAGDGGALSVTLVTPAGTGGIAQGAAPITLGAGSVLRLEGGAAESLPDFSADLLVAVTADSYLARASGAVVLQPGSDVDPADLLPVLESGGTATLESIGDNVRVVDGLDAISVNAGESAALSLIAEGNVTLANPDGSIGRAAGPQGALTLSITSQDLNINGASTLSVIGGDVLRLTRRGDATLAGNAGVTFDTRTFDFWEVGATVEFAATAFGGASGDLTVEGGFSDATAVNVPAGLTGAVGLFAEGQLAFANASGGVVQTPGGGAFDLTLRADTFSFDAGEPIEVAAGGSVSITGLAAADIGLRDITAPELSVVSGLGIRQNGTTGLVVSGSASFVGAGAGDLVLGDGDLANASNANDFASVSAVTGSGDVSLDDVGGMIVGDVAGGALDLLSDGAVTQQAGTTVVVGAATLEAAGVTLEEAGNAFAELEATAPGQAVSIRDDAGDLLLGDVVAGSFDLLAAGAVDQRDAGLATGSALSVGGAVAISAGGAVDLDNTANAIGAASVLAPGFAVEITDSAGALGLGSVAASSLTLRASGAVTQTPGTTVEVATLADLSTTAGGVTLGEAGNAFATVDVSAPGDVTIDDDDGGITLAGVSGADVTIRTQGAVVLSGAFAATGDALISAVAPAGPAPDIDLTGPGISFASIGAEAVGGAGRGAVSLASASGITLGRVTAATLVVAAEGSIDQLSADPADRIDVSGAASFVQSSPLLQSVDLSNPSNEFSSLQIFSAGPLDVVSIADATAVTLGDISVQTALTVEAAGGIVDGGLLTAPTAVFRAVGPGADVTLDFGHDFGAVTLAAGGDVVVNDTDAALFSGLQLNAVDAGSLFVTTPGAVTQPLVADGAGVVVGGETFIQQGALFPVLLSDVDNDFGSVRLGGFAPTVDLRDRTGIALDGIATTVLDVTAGGDVTDIAPLSASALAVRVTGGGDVLLDAANAFGTASVDAAGGGVALRDADGGGLVLGNLRAASLAVLANGPVTQSFGTSVGTAGAPVADAEITALNGGPRDVTLTGANDFDRLSVIGSAVAVNDVDGLALVDSRAERSLSVTAGGALELTRVSVDGLGGAFLQTLSATGASIAATDLVTDLGTTALTATGGDVSLSEFSVAGLDLTLNLPGTRTLLMRLGEVGDLGFSVPVVRELTLDGVVFAGGIRGGAFATPGRVEAADLVRLDRVRTPGFLDVVAGGVQLGRIDAPALSVTATGGAGISTFTGLLGDVAAGDRVAFAAPVAPAPPATAGDGRTRPGPGQPALDGGGAYAALVDVPGTTTLFAVAPGASVALDQGVTVALGGGPVTLENDFGTVQGAADAGFALRDASALRLGGIDVANGGVTVEAATVSAGALDGAGAAIFADTATVSTGVAGSDVTLTGPNDVDALNATVAGVLTFRDLDGLALGPIAADDVRLDAATASAGALTQTAGITTGTLAVSTSAGASDIVLTQLNAVDRLEASSSGSLSFREADALALGPMTAAGDVTLEAAVSAAGALTQTDPLSAGRLEVSTAQPGSPITLGEANAVDVLAAVATGTLAFLDASGGLDLAGVSAPSLDLETAGALTQSAPVTADAAGASSLRAASILLTLSGNEFGALDARTLDPDGPGALPRGDLALAEDAGGVHSRLLGGAVDVAVAGGDVTLDDVDAETLSVFAGNGPILQTPTGITVAGRSDFVSVGPAFGVILETSAANDFGGRVDATADAGARIGILDSAGDLFLGDL